MNQKCLGTKEIFFDFAGTCLYICRQNWMCRSHLAFCSSHCTWIQKLRKNFMQLK